MGNSIDLSEIEASLQTRWLGQRPAVIELWETIDSTNNRGKELARAGQSAGAIIIAAHQSAGRGRSNNVWHSPVNSGLYLSFIVSPKLVQTKLAVTTLVVGVAVAQAIQSALSTKVGLKWVNDLIIDGRKLGGILVEFVSVPEPALIIGIGLNLYKGSEKLPADLNNKIAFLDDFIAVNKPNAIDRNRLIAAIANELEIALDKMQSELPALLDQWRAYSVTLGQQIMVSLSDKQIIGQALDITDSGELVVKTNAGNINIAAGAVSIRKADGGYA